MSLVKKWRFEVSSSGVKSAAVIDEVVVYRGKHHTSFDLSACGRFLALGSPSGDVAVVSTASMSVIALTQSHGFTVTAVTLAVPFTAADLAENISNANNHNNNNNNNNNTNHDGNGPSSPSKSKKNRSTATTLDFDDLTDCHVVSCALDPGLVAKSIERSKIKSSHWWKYAIGVVLICAYLAFNYATMKVALNPISEDDTAWPNSDQL
jgi:hypothetical protein